MPLFDHEAFARKFAKGMSDQDKAVITGLVTDDFVTDWPQSGERVRGMANFWGILDNYPGRVGSGDDLGSLHVQPSAGLKLMAPNYTFVAVEGAGNAGTYTLRVVYPDGSVWWVVTLYRLRGERMASATTFFAPVFPAPDWRAQWVERM